MTNDHRTKKFEKRKTKKTKEGNEYKKGTQTMAKQTRAREGNKEREIIFYDDY